MRVLCWLNSKFVPNAFDSRRIQHASLWCMVHAAGSSSRRLLVFHTASNEAEEQQSAKELKGAEHIEKHPRKRKRERRGGEPKHFHPIISSNFIKTRLDRPSAPNCNHSRATTQCTHCIRYYLARLSSSSAGNRVAFSSFAACFFVALNSSRRSAGGKGIGSRFLSFQWAAPTVDCGLSVVDCFSYLVSTFM